MRTKSLLVAAAATLLLAACAPSIPTGMPASPPVPQQRLEELRVGYGLPDCPETDPDAEQVDGGLPRTALLCLGSDTVVNLAGLPREPMIINLWAQWCAPCRQEAPYLRAALADMEGVGFLGINYDDDKPDWALEFADLVGWRYPHVMDQTKSLQGPLRVPGLPTTIFVTADGRIAGVHPGVLESEQQLRDLAHEYLGVSS